MTDAWHVSEALLQRLAAMLLLMIKNVIVPGGQLHFSTSTQIASSIETEHTLKFLCFC